jgi:hypothetical protein
MPPPRLLRSSHRLPNPRAKELANSSRLVNEEVRMKVVIVGLALFLSSNSSTGEIVTCGSTSVGTANVNNVAHSSDHGSAAAACRAAKQMVRDAETAGFAAAGISCEVDSCEHNGGGGNFSCNSSASSSGGIPWGINCIPYKSGGRWHASAYSSGAGPKNMHCNDCPPPGGSGPIPY